MTSYREIRVENSLIEGNGNKERLKKGEEVDVTLEADGKGKTEEE